MFFVEEQKILETRFAQNSRRIESIELVIRKQTIHSRCVAFRRARVRRKRGSIARPIVLHVAA